MFVDTNVAVTDVVALCVLCIFAMVLESEIHTVADADENPNLSEMEFENWAKLAPNRLTVSVPVVALLMLLPLDKNGALYENIAEKDVSTRPTVTLKSTKDKWPRLTIQLIAVSEFHKVRWQMELPDRTEGWLLNEPKYFPLMFITMFPVAGEFK